MKKIKNLLLSFTIFANILGFANCPFHPKKPKNETIICIHGFLGSPWQMVFFKKNFKKHGWEFINWQYNSRDKIIKHHAHDLALMTKKFHKNNPNKKISFVAHSLGSLVLRSAFNDPVFPQEIKDAKIVLIGPPNKGTCFARKLHSFSLFRKFARNYAGKELATAPNFNYLGEFPNSCDILIIAGNLSLNPFIKEESDGTVAVSETYLNTKHKHVVIKRDHTGMLFSKKAFSIALDFLYK